MQGAESIKTMEGKFSKITSSWLKMQKTIPISMDMISANFSRKELELLEEILYVTAYHLAYETEGLFCYGNEL